MAVSREWFDKYLGYGWSVIPVVFSQDDSGKVTKKPMVSWRAYMTRQATPEEVDGWFSLREPDGIGLVTGAVSNVVAVDVDTKENPLSLVSSTVSKSAFSGGHHYLYRWSEAIRNTVKIDGMPIDFRGDGGYIVLPPSEFMGKMYSWESFDLDALPSLPEAVKQMLTTERKKSEKIFTNDQFNPYPDVYAGERNQKVTQIAGSLIGELSPKLWQSVGWDYMQNFNANHVHPPLGDAELRTIYNSVMGMEARTIVSEETQEVVDIPKPVSVKEIAQRRLEEKKLENIAPSTGYKDLDKFIKGFIPGHVYTMTGDTNVGKTTICCNFADRVSKQGKKVLYFALEPENTIVDYLASVRTGKRFDMLTESDLMCEDPNISVYGKEQIQRVEDMVKVVDALPRYDLIIIDHIGYFTTDGRDLNIKQSNVMKTLAALAKAKQCAIMLVAHIRKRQNPKGTTVSEDDISGSAAFKQDATEVIIITRKFDEDQDGNVIYLDEGLINVRKTKTGGGQGSVSILFKPGTALIQEPSEIVTALWQ